jgi:hypothetical protein
VLRVRLVFLVVALPPICSFLCVTASQVQVNGMDDEGARRDVDDEDDYEAQGRAPRNVDEGALRNVYCEDDYEAQRRARRDADDEDDSIDESSEEEEEEKENDDGDHQRHVRETRVLWERCDPLTYYNDVDFHRNFRLIVKTALSRMILPNIDSLD